MTYNIHYQYIPSILIFCRRRNKARHLMPESDRNGEFKIDTTFPEQHLSVKF